jgi:hypothetical protein
MGPGRRTVLAAAAVGLVLVVAAALVVRAVAGREPVLLLAAGLGNLAIADGSALLFVALLGLAAWLVWLLATGVRLVVRR